MNDMTADDAVRVLSNVGQATHAVGLVTLFLIEAPNLDLVRLELNNAIQGLKDAVELIDGCEVDSKT